jgi:hypothetical protein
VKMATTQQFSTESTVNNNLPYQIHQYNYHQQQQQQHHQNYHPINSYQSEHNNNQQHQQPSLESHNYSHGHNNNNSSWFNGPGQNGHHYWNQFYGQNLPHQQQQQQPNTQSHHNYNHQSNINSQNQTNPDGNYDNRLFSPADTLASQSALNGNAALIEHWKQLTGHYAQHSNERIRMLTEARKNVEANLLNPDRLKRKLESETENDSPALRALLTNPLKKLKYSPYYFYGNVSPVSSTDVPPTQKRVDSSANDSFNSSTSKCDHRVPDTNPLSPNKTDDSIEYLEYDKNHISQHQQKPYKDGYETNPPSVDNMLSQHLTQTSPSLKSPMRHLVEVIATPPLSPHSAYQQIHKPPHASQNAVYGDKDEKYAESSPSVESDWQQNEETGM